MTLVVNKLDFCVTIFYRLFETGFEKLYVKKNGYRNVLPSIKHNMTYIRTRS